MNWNRLLPALAALAACGGEERGPTNVLLVSLDSTRRDLLGAYGWRTPRVPGATSSPNLDRLAAEGVLMEDAYATTSWTLPSHMSLFTGEPEVVHGVEIDYLRPDPERATLAELLDERGYRTAGFFSGPYLDPRFGFDQGFDRYVECYGDELSSANRVLRLAERALEEATDATRAVAARRHQEAVMAVERLSHKDVSSRTVVDHALEELEAAAAGEEPWFLFVHFFDPHYDYLPPPPHDTALDPDYAGDIDGHDFWVSPRISEPHPERPRLRVQRASERDLEHVRALYAGELAWTDAQLGRLFDRLGELGLSDSTLVVVVSDHGDEFFEHGSIGHRRTLFEEVVRVPMLLRLPGVLPRGRRVSGLVSLVDVVDTVLDLLDLPRLEGLTSRSMLPLIRGAEEGAERDVFGRFFSHSPVTIDMTVEGEPASYPARITQVLETYRHGPIKITRERRWPEPMGPMPPVAEEAFLEHQAEVFAQERLHWIDVVRHPDERPQDHSADFTDPRASAALERFRARYEELLARRTQVGLDLGDGGMVGLQGLGYAEEGAPESAEEIGRFVLPPPGEGR